MEEEQKKKEQGPLRRILITVAYDGTNYHGFQKQNSGAVTIEGVLNDTLTNVFKEPIEVIGASRTDTGVHAYGNLAVFDTHSRIEAEKVPYALNRSLPEDIRVLCGEEVPLDFHPRKCDTIKTYEYRIYNAPFNLPQKRLYSYWTYAKLDVEKMQRATGYFIGTHDFASFCSAGTQTPTTVRTLYELTVETDDPFDSEDDPEAPVCRDIIIRVSGSGFLYNMVRIIAGTLMEVGKGRIEPEQIADIIEARDREAAGPTAPPEGLTLVGYEITGKA